MINGEEQTDLKGALCSYFTKAGKMVMAVAWVGEAYDVIIEQAFENPYE